MSSLSIQRLCLYAMIGLIGVGIMSAIFVGVDDRVGLELLREHQYDLLNFVTSKPVLAGVLFTVIYALVVVASIPGLALLTMAGGFLFGWVAGTIYTMIAATIASAGVFLLARSAFGGPLRRRAGPMVQRFVDGFKESALSYVFILHLIPVFPYLVVITLPAVCGVPLHVYMFSAFFGILPATILLARVGAGLGDVLSSSGTIDLTNFMTTDIMVSLAGLAVLALLPVALTMRSVVMKLVRSIASAGVFLLARSAFGGPLRRRAGPMVQRFVDGFKESALSYVFILHLIPVFPYLVVITLPAVCGVPLHVYMFSAFFGILPATILLARVGAGLGDVLSSSGTIDLTNFMTTDIMVSLAGLAVLALLPVALRALKSRL